MDTTSLSKVLRDAMKGGKYAMGSRECIAGMKGAKALLCTRSVPEAMSTKLRAEAQKHNVTVLDVPLTSAELARLVGRPYKVSAMTLKSVSEAELRQLLR